MSDRYSCDFAWRYNRVVTHYCHKQAFMKRFDRPGIGPVWLCWMHRLREFAGF